MIMFLYFIVDLRARRVDLRARRVDLQARRVDLQARRVDLQARRVDLQAKCCLIMSVTRMKQIHLGPIFQAH